MKKISAFLLSAFITSSAFAVDELNQKNNQIDKNSNQKEISYQDPTGVQTYFNTDGLCTRQNV